MNFKPIALGLALAVTTLASHATSSLTLVSSNLGITATGFLRLTGFSGSFNASVQDQVGSTGGLANWGPLTPSTEPYASSTGIALTSVGGTHAEVVKAAPGIVNSLTVSTPTTGGFAQAEQDFILSFLLGAHTTVTFSWDTALSGSNAGASAGVFSALGTLNLGDQSASYPFSLDFAGTAGSGSGFSGTPIHRSISFTNNSDTTILSSYHSNIKISTRDVATAVPEPEVAWMALAGLALVGAQIRRRR